MKNNFLIVVIGIMVFVFITGCGKSAFDGNITSSDGEFIVEYSLLDKTETHEMDLTKDDVIGVTIDNVSGALDIMVSDIDGNKIYRANDAETGKFELTIPETNKYKFSVTGKNAKGIVSFKLVH